MNQSSNDAPDKTDKNKTQEQNPVLTDSLLWDIVFAPQLVFPIESL